MKKNSNCKNVIYFTENLNVKPVYNNNLEKSGYFVDENSLIYTKEDNKYIPYPIRNDKGRLYANLKLGKWKRCYPTPRIALMSFEAIHMPYEAYSEYEVDHIDPSRPLNNNIKNLEWVTPQENMRRAGETGVMIKKYNKDLVHEICQRIINGESRKKIVEDLGVNENLVYDIKTGKSHKSVSRLYLDKGFEYQTVDIDDRRDIAIKVCELIEQGLDNKEIYDLMKNEVSNRCFIADIRAKRTYRYISKDYNF